MTILSSPTTWQATFELLGPFQRARPIFGVSLQTSLTTCCSARTEVGFTVRTIAAPLKHQAVS